ncbi:hypothetical protein JCM14469_21070 [Desulfatiferula olefinivorans]
MKNLNLVDVVFRDIQPNAWILVDNGKIAARGVGSVDNPPGRVVFDMRNRYPIPGLIDTHCHSTSSPIFSMRMVDTMRHNRQLKQNYAAAIESGVTTIRDMGAFSGLLRYFIRQIKDGTLPGPRVTYFHPQRHGRSP